MQQRALLLIVFLCIAIGGVVYWYYQAAPGFEVPLMTGLSWQAGTDTDGVFLESFFCPTPAGVTCANDAEKRITLPTGGRKVYAASIRHTPPVPLSDDAAWQRAQDFHTYYEQQLTAMGFVHADLTVPGGHFMHSTYEQGSRVTDFYGRMTNGMYQEVAVQTNQEDSTDCAESQKNLLDGCDVLAAELFSITLSQRMPITDVLALPKRDRNDPGR